MRSKHKYGAVRTTLDGLTFDSRAESQYYAQLKILQRVGEVTDIILQPRFHLLESFTKNGKKYRGIEYVADFWVTYKNGRREIVDVKGKKTEAYQIKRKWFESKYPDLTITEVQT